MWLPQSHGRRCGLTRASPRVHPHHMWPPILIMMNFGMMRTSSTHNCLNLHSSIVHSPNYFEFNGNHFYREHLPTLTMSGLGYVGNPNINLSKLSSKIASTEDQVKLLQVLLFCLLLSCYSSFNH